MSGMRASPVLGAAPASALRKAAQSCSPGEPRGRREAQVRRAGARTQTTQPARCLPRGSGETHRSGTRAQTTQHARCLPRGSRRRTGRARARTPRSVHAGYREVLGETHRSGMCTHTMQCARWLPRGSGEAQVGRAGTRTQTTQPARWLPRGSTILKHKVHYKNHSNSRCFRRMIGHTSIEDDIINL